MGHTILLIQSLPRHDSRSWCDFESVADCMDAIVKIFEEHLKKLNNTSSSVSYDIRNLFEFIDCLADLSCIVWNQTINAYTPHNKDWIKQQIYVLLRGSIGSSSRTTRIAANSRVHT